MALIKSNIRKPYLKRTIRKSNKNKLIIIRSRKVIKAMSYSAFCNFMAVHQKFKGNPLRMASNIVHIRVQIPEYNIIKIAKKTIHLSYLSGTEFKMIKPYIIDN